MACGAPVSIDGSCRNVICRYCGATIVIADFEEIKVAEAVANAQIVQESLNLKVADRKRERIEQLETDLHTAEKLVAQSETRTRIAGFIGLGSFVLCFVVSWYFLLVGLLCGLFCLVNVFGVAGQKVKILAIRKQLDSIM